MCEYYFEKVKKKKIKKIKSNKNQRIEFVIRNDAVERYTGTAPLPNWEIFFAFETAIPQYI